MAFPWSDDFNRADGSLGSNWTQDVNTTCAIASNKMTPGGTAERAVRWGKDFDRLAYGPDYYAQAKIDKGSTNNGTVGIQVRQWAASAANGYTGNASNGIMASVRKDPAGGTSDQLQLYKQDNGTFTQLGSTVAEEWTDGDLLRIEVQQDAVRVYRAGVLKISHTLSASDAAKFPFPGSVRIRFFNQAAGRIDDFEAGFLTDVQNIIGHTVHAVTDTTANIGFITSHASEVRVVYGTNSTLSSGTSNSSSVTTSVGGTSTIDDGGTGRITLSGLTANTQYYYKLQIFEGGSWVDKTTHGGNVFGTFKTFPAAGSAVSFSFAVSSCIDSDATSADDRICYHMAQDSAIRFFAFLGDTVYTDSSSVNLTGDNLAEFRAKHRQGLTGGRRSHFWAALRRTKPTFANVDDHEFRNNFDDGTSAAYYQNGKKAWRETWGQGNPSPIQAGELYYSFAYGNVGFFFTDGRSYRSASSATDNASKTYLGATQKADLKAWLLANKTTYAVKVICNATSISGWCTTGNDSWGGADDGSTGYTTELNEILDYIIANNIPGVIFLAADQHWSASSIRTRNGKNFYEMMCSPIQFSNLTKTTHAIDSSLLYKFDGSQAYGKVTIDTTVDDPTISFLAVQSDGTNAPTSGAGAGANPVSFAVSDIGISAAVAVRCGDNVSLGLGLGISL